MTIKNFVFAIMGVFFQVLSCVFGTIVALEMFTEYSFKFLTNWPILVGLSVAFLGCSIFCFDKARP
jgi:hypothetical protein